MNRTDPDETLDLTGVACPGNTARTLLKLEGMDPGSVLEIIIDDGEPLENLPPAVEEDGYKILKRTRHDRNRWKILIKRG